MIVHLAAIAGVVMVTVIFGLVMQGAHENQTAKKAELGISCASCSSKGTCSRSTARG